MSTPGVLSSNSSPANATVSSSTAEQSTQTYACVLCSQRKIKCDKRQPCSRCIKSRAECVYRAPDPPKRRKRKEPDDSDGLRSKLQEYERLLKQAGIQVKVAIGSEDQKPSTRTADQAIEEPGQPSSGVPGKGHLFVHGSKIRYHENELYGSFETEFQQNSDMFKEEEPEEPSAYLVPSIGAQDPTSLLFGSSLRTEDTAKLFPPPEHAMQMWEIFKDRVDPLLKIFHTSHKETRFKHVLNDMARQSWTNQSWVFAICLVAVHSLSDDECIEFFGEPKSDIFSRLKHATQQALIGAGLLRSSDTIVLQGYLMFLIAVAHEYDASTYWIMTGIALRIAQRGGLHRDQSAIRGTGSWPWHAEMRRRIWWQIILLDMRASELTGLGRSFSFIHWDTKLPLNINDSDLGKGMTDLPEEHTGATEMMYCRMTYDMCNFFREVRSAPSVSQEFSKLNMLEASPNEKDKFIDELERHLEQRFLRYCDPLVPLHEMCLYSARAAVAASRLMLHYPRNDYSKEGENMPLERRHLLFTSALKVIEYCNRIYDSKGTRKFAWSMTMRFPWHALVFILNELRTRTVDAPKRAWELIEQFVNYNPILLKQSSRALHIACGSLAIKAWDARFQQLEMHEQEVPKEPEFISQLRMNKAEMASVVQQASRCSTTGQRISSDMVYPTPLAENMNLHVPADVNSLDPALAGPSNVNLDFSPTNWSQWDDLILQNFELPQSFPDLSDMFT